MVWEGVSLMINDLISLFLKNKELENQSDQNLRVFSILFLNY